MFPIEQHTIFLTLAGSQAHGTARAGSDVDLRGVCVAPLRSRLSLFRTFEQHEGQLPQALAETVIPRIKSHPTAARGLNVKTESVIFEVAKFLGLCAAANPNALEILFADERDWLFETPTWRRLHDARHLFLTKKVQHTFHGYAVAQLRKIKTHRSWLLNPPTKKPTREDFGLPASGASFSRDDQNRIEQGIAAKLRSYGIDDIDMPKSTRIAIQERLDAFYMDVLAASGEDLEGRMRTVAAHGLQLPADIMSSLNAEKKYQAALKHWNAYQAWKTHRNPARAALEQRHGYDTKHAMHLVRLMRMGVEVLQTGELRVRRDDAAELSAIRDGAMSFDELLDATVSLEKSTEKAATTATLPHDVDRDHVEELFVSMLEAR